MTRSILIVGAGHAGASVAFKLRALGFDGDITLLSDEDVPPYHRPPLSKKYIAEHADPQRLHLKHTSWYDTQRVSLRLGCRVQDIHVHERYVTLADGDRLAYGHLVLATGARPRRLDAVPGGDARNILTFRTLADAEQLRAACGPDRRLLVVGGGYIGLETAAVARGLGMQVTLIEREPRLLGRVAAQETADYFRALHQSHGVDIREGVGLVRFDVTQGRASAAHLSDGTRINVDVVVAGIGVVPETRLAEQAGLAVDDGIVVDAHCRTSDPWIFAAGDCARFPYENGLTRLESVPNAVEMAEVIARTLMDTPAEYRPVPWFWSDQYATKLQIAGLLRGHTRVAVRRDTEHGLSVWYYAQDRFLAVDAINDARAFMTARQWLSAGFHPPYDTLSDPDIPLATVAEAAVAQTAPAH